MDSRTCKQVELTSREVRVAESQRYSSVEIRWTESVREQTHDSLHLCLFISARIFEYWISHQFDPFELLVSIEFSSSPIKPQSVAFGKDPRHCVWN